MRLIPAPRGTGIVSAPVPKKLLQMAGIEDCYTSARGQTATLGNFGKGTLVFVFPHLEKHKLEQVFRLVSHWFPIYAYFAHPLSKYLMKKRIYIILCPPCCSC